MRIEPETPLAECQLALSRAVEHLQKLPEQGLSPQIVTLFRLYLAQADEALTAAAKGDAPLEAA